MRQRVLVFLAATILLLGGAVLIYLERTGVISIFADVPNVPGTLSVTQPVDLQKGIRPGSNIEIRDNQLTLTQGATDGSCQFDVGSPQIKQFFRFRPVKNADLPDGTTVDIQFASSLDGVSFGPLSSPVRLDQSAGAPDSIDLTAVLPENVHFVRIECSLHGNQTTAPSFGGFLLDYEALNVPSTTSGPLSILAEPLKGQAPLTTKFTRSASDTSCDWDFGDTATKTSPETSVSHAYQQPGTYTVTLSCNDQQGTRTVTATTSPYTAVSVKPILARYPLGNPVTFVIHNDGPATIAASVQAFRVKNSQANTIIFDTSNTALDQPVTESQDLRITWDQKDSSGIQVPAGVYELDVPYQIGDTTQIFATLVTVGNQSSDQGLDLAVQPIQGQTPLTVSIATSSGSSLIDFGDGTVQSFAQPLSSVVHTYTDPGTYTLSRRNGQAVNTQVVLATAGEAAEAPTVPLLINGYLAGTSQEADTADLADKPTTLIATGFLDLATNSLIVIWILATVGIFLYRPKTHVR